MTTIDRRRFLELGTLGGALGAGLPPRAFAVFLVVGLIAVITLWAGFAVDYTTTRDIYFAFAIGHVLAEFPFLVKML